MFVLSWARVQQVRWGSLSSELLMCGGGVCSILLLPLVARCLETIDVCIWHMFVFMSVVVTVWGSVGMIVVYRQLLKIVFLALECWSMLWMWWMLCFLLYCMWVLYVSVSSCRCCMFVSCVHHVAVLNAAFCITCSLLMLF